MIAEEYPVEYPQDGPPQERQTSALDIWVAGAGFFAGLSGRPAVSCQVECKKADPGFIDWVFFRKHGDAVRFRHLTLHRAHDRTPALVLHDGNLTMFLSDDGRELKGHYRAQDRTRSTSTRIQDAARQAALATLSVGFTLIRSQVYPFDRLQVVHFVPVVVTTANLLLCDFPLDQVDLASGQLPKGAAVFTPQEYVVYDYPLTGGLAMRPEGVEFSNEEVTTDPEALVKMHVLIVNSTAGLDRLVSKMDPLRMLVEGL